MRCIWICSITARGQALGTWLSLYHLPIIVITTCKLTQDMAFWVTGHCRWPVKLRDFSCICFWFPAWGSSPDTYGQVRSATVLTPGNGHDRWELQHQCPLASWPGVFYSLTDACSWTESQLPTPVTSPLTCPAMAFSSPLPNLPLSLPVPWYHLPNQPPAPKLLYPALLLGGTQPKTL